MPFRDCRQLWAGLETKKVIYILGLLVVYTFLIGPRRLSHRDLSPPLFPLPGPWELFLQTGSFIIGGGNDSFLHRLRSMAGGSASPGIYGVFFILTIAKGFFERVKIFATPLTRKVTEALWKRWITYYTVSSDASAAVLFCCFIGVAIGTLGGGASRIGPSGCHFSSVAGYLSCAARRLDHHAGRDLLWGHVRWVHDLNLVNLPGEAASVVTCLDGYQMARKGRAGVALGISAFGSFIAGTVGIIGLTFLAPPSGLHGAPVRTARNTLPS